LYQSVRSGQTPTPDPVTACEILASASVVRINNVVTYLWAMSDKRDWDTATDLPTPISPWPVAWLEWRVPQRIRIDGLLVPTVGAGSSMGVLVETRATDEGYTALLTGFLHDRITRIALTYDKSGNLTHCPTDTEIAQGSTDFTAELLSLGETLESIGAGLRYMFLLPVLLTFTFAHARNISTESEEFNRGLQNKRQERGRAPVVKVYTLKIDALDSMLRSTGKLGSGSSLPQALHICRGGFRTYTEDRPLFGKNVGTWFWAMHVRGKASSGVVRKDYEVALSHVTKSP
jgi:hypothetical protein